MVKTATKRPPKKRGPPPWNPSKQERMLIEHYVATGFTRAQIGELVGKSEDSLVRHCRHELETGDLKANAKISGALFAKAMKGDTGALIWWEKTRRGLSEKTVLEHQGKDGGPIEYTNLSDEEIDARIDSLTGGKHVPGVTTH